ncbi:hypothetical protein LOK49_LG15G01037 [Camellia lanceoleosa]|uniref:Uncharacterized protein n=1 Tax=Camellia lanceoleosa TaxID=1840588 RepID=A0ACC0F2D6_9ERIC|nr:hypothetical protein LOK49_LG15G01037 [Camellia lanceoleosa]
MWRRSWSFILLKQNGVSWGVRYKPKPPLGLRLVAAFSSQVSSSGGGGGGGESITFEEAKKLMRLVNVEELKMKLGTMQGKEVIGYSELLRACHSMGVSKSEDEVTMFARVLDQAGVVLLFRDNVYLHPDKKSREELRQLQEKKEEIDIVAHKQVRRILWSGHGLAVAQVGLFFRLTFWEFSWDVMDPIAFFATATGIVIGYAYFLSTSRDPTYEDLLKRLFLSRRRKLIKKHDFDAERFMELQRKCKCPLDSPGFVKQRIGVEMEYEDAFH